MPLDDMGFLDVHAALELLESSRLSVDESDDLSIENERATGLRREFFERGDDLRKLFRFILAVSRDQSDFIGRGVSENADAVVLGLEGPAFTGGFGADAGVHRLEC